MISEKIMDQFAQDAYAKWDSAKDESFCTDAKECDNAALKKIGFYAGFKMAFRIVCQIINSPKLHEWEV